MLPRWPLAAVLCVGACTVGATTAGAQALPSGSYQRSCTQIHWAGTELVAECRKVSGDMIGSGLANAVHCKGDIANVDGRLVCNLTGAAPAAGAAPQRGTPPATYGGGGSGPGYGGGAPGLGFQSPGYGGGSGPRPSYGSGGAPGSPPPGQYGYDGRRVRCEELWHRRDELRGSLQYTAWGPERERLEYRLRELHEERERLGCG
jgi:hypothetical protein